MLLTHGVKSVVKKWAQHQLGVALFYVIKVLIGDCYCFSCYLLVLIAGFDGEMRLKLCLLTGVVSFSACFVQNVKECACEFS